MICCGLVHSPYFLLRYADSALNGRKAVDSQIACGRCQKIGFMSTVFMSEQALAGAVTVRVSITTLQR